MDRSNSAKSNNIIDIIKFVCCLLIIGIHTHPVFRNNTWDFYSLEYIARIAVPFFFISSGYFFAGMDENKRISYIKRIALLYLIASVIYIPIYMNDGIKAIAGNLILAYFHLWYLSTLAISLLVLMCVYIRLPKYRYFLILLILPAAFFALYSKLTGVEVLEYIGETLENTRFDSYLKAIPFLLIGDYIRNSKISISRGKSIILLVIALAASFLEAMILRKVIGADITLNTSLFGWMPAVPLFLIGLNTRSFMDYDASRKLRKTADVIYIIHVWVIEFAVKVTGLEYISLYLFTASVSIILSVLIIFIIDLLKKKTALSDHGRSIR